MKTKVIANDSMLLSQLAYVSESEWLKVNKTVPADVWFAEVLPIAYLNR